MTKPVCKVQKNRAYRGTKGWVVRLEEPRQAASLKKSERRWFWTLRNSAFGGRDYFHFGSSEGAGVPRFGWNLAGRPGTPKLPRALASGPILGDPLSHGRVLPPWTDSYARAARQIDRKGYLDLEYFLCF